jgi:ABC-type ATPase with predicted acetyltransferase domain
MQTYEVLLKSDPPTGFYCLKAANSVDLDIEKKLTHHLKVRADIDTPYNVGIIIGNSGSGKTTLAKQIWGENCFDVLLNPDLSVIEQFDESYSYDERVSFLSGVGLGSPVTWIQPAKTLSNGQQSRCEVALQVARLDGKFTVIDEFTSVVDRTVAKAMAHSVQKVARKNKKTIVLLSCHYDIIEWVDPDWIIDCNTHDYIDRRLLPRGNRSEELVFGIRQLTDSKSWKVFSKYHYLSDSLPPGKTYMFGLFHEDIQIGFIAYSNYVMWKQEHKDAGIPMVMHANRIVVHPDYCGFGLGGRMTDITADYMKHELGFDVQIKLSSASMANLLKRNERWELRDVSRNVHNIWSGKGRNGRMDVKTYSFKFLG